jgi:hypothetical protein
LLRRIRSAAARIHYAATARRVFELALAERESGEAADLPPIPDVPEVVIADQPERPRMSDVQPPGEPPEIPDRLISSDS